jgi:hypothetical protein
VESLARISCFSNRQREEAEDTPGRGAFTCVLDDRAASRSVTRPAGNSTGERGRPSSMWTGRKIAKSSGSPCTVQARFVSGTGPRLQNRPGTVSGPYTEPWPSLGNSYPFRVGPGTGTFAKCTGSGRTRDRRSKKYRVPGRVRDRGPDKYWVPVPGPGQDRDRGSREKVGSGPNRVVYDSRGAFRPFPFKKISNVRSCRETGF